jgi:phosphate transport system protein
MSKSLERDLGRLENDLLAMGGAVGREVARSVAAIRGETPKPARGPDEDDPDVEEDQMEEECLRLLALHQPVAGDLRRVTAALLIANELSYIAEVAEDMALRVEEVGEHRACPPPPAELQSLADLATGLVRESLESFIQLDPRLARSTTRLRAEADRRAAAAGDELAAALRMRPDCG